MKSKVAKKTGWGLGILLATLLPVSGFCQGISDADTGSAQALIAVPFLVTVTAPLEFGQIRPGDVDGSVVIDPQFNTREGFDGVQAVASAPWSRAEFAITGQPNAPYSVDMVASTAIHDQGTDPEIGVKSLFVDPLTGFSVTLNPPAAQISPNVTGKINGLGSDTLYVGGTLQVPTTARNGKYEGEVMVTVNFN